MCEQRPTAVHAPPGSHYSAIFDANGQYESMHNIIHHFERLSARTLIAVYPAAGGSCAAMDTWGAVERTAWFQVYKTELDNVSVLMHTFMRTSPVDPSGSEFRHQLLLMDARSRALCPRPSMLVDFRTSIESLVNLYQRSLQRRI